MMAGLAMGAGIAAMHYVGMAAMKTPAGLAYDPLLVGASVLIAVVASTAALFARGRAVAGLADGRRGDPGDRRGGHALHRHGALEVTPGPWRPCPRRAALCARRRRGHGTLMILCLALLASLYDSG